MRYVPPCEPSTTCGAGEDWRFVIQDIRDADGSPLDLTGYRLRLQFRPASLRGMLICDLQEGTGLTLTHPSPDRGPTVAILSRACARTWLPLVDTPVVGDLMMFRGDAPEKDSVLIKRIAFTATWGVTRDG